MYQLIEVIHFAASAFSLLVIVRVFLSWTGLDTRNALVEMIYRLTEPLMGPARRLLPPAGGIDFSPMIVLGGIWLAERVLTSLLLSMA